MSPVLGIIASQMTGHLVTSSYESIATVTVGSGGATSIDFTSIPSTYTHLQLRLIGRDNRASSEFTVLYLNFNGDKTSGNYWQHALYGNGATVTSNGSGSGASQIPFGLDTASTATTNVFGTVILDILDYKDTNKYKTIKSLFGYDNNGSGRVGLYSGVWNSKSAITNFSITAAVNPTFIANSSFALYGIKG